MLTLDKARLKINEQLAKDGITRLEIGKICNENFGWIFLLYKKSDDELIVGGIDGYLIDKKLNVIIPISQRYIKKLVLQYQKENGYPEGILDLQAYELPLFPETFSQKIRRKIENWLWVK